MTLESHTVATRRTFLQTSAHGFGGLTLGSLLASESAEASPALSVTHLPAKAKRVIWLFQSGGPSQSDLFDPKPALEKHRGGCLLW